MSVPSFSGDPIILKVSLYSIYKFYEILLIRLEMAETAIQNTICARHQPPMRKL